MGGRVLEGERGREGGGRGKKPEQAPRWQWPAGPGPDAGGSRRGPRRIRRGSRCSCGLTWATEQRGHSIVLSAQCQTSGTGPRYPSLLGKSLERVINGECSSCYSGRAFPEAGPRGTRPKPTGRKTQSWVSGTRRAPSTSFLRVQTSVREATETQAVVYCECRRRSQCGRAGPGGRTRGLLLVPPWPQQAGGHPGLRSAAWRTLL